MKVDLFCLCSNSPETVLTYVLENQTLQLGIGVLNLPPPPKPSSKQKSDGSR